jgi:GTP pyrophosphokinase
VVGSFLPEAQPKSDETALQTLPVKGGRVKPRSVRGGVRVQGVDDVLVHFARCCQPLPGDKVAGFITRGRGVTVHARDCANLQIVDSERLIPVEWNVEQGGSHLVRVRVLCADRKGILASIANTLSQSDINITNAQVQTTPDRKAMGVFEVEVKDLKHLEGALQAVRRIGDVFEADRIRT